MESPKRKFAEIECLGSETAEERQRKRFARAEREKQVIVIDDDLTASLENEIKSKDLEIDKLLAIIEDKNLDASIDVLEESIDVLEDRLADCDLENDKLQAQNAYLTAYNDELRYQNHDLNLDIQYIGVLEESFNRMEMSKDLEIDKLRAQNAYLTALNQEADKIYRICYNRLLGTKNRLGY